MKPSLLRLAAMALTTLMAGVPAIAQEATSGLGGIVSDNTGSATPNLDVTILNTRTGETRIVKTDANGAFSVQGLAPDGPYSIYVSAGDYSALRVEDVQVSMGGAQRMILELPDLNEGYNREPIVIPYSSLVQENVPSLGTPWVSGTVSGIQQIAASRAPDNCLYPQDIADGSFPTIGDTPQYKLAAVNTTLLSVLERRIGALRVGAFTNAIAESCSSTAPNEFEYCRLLKITTKLDKP